ncbi:hypothetical protein [Reyranella sp.]|uniref:hypothetical protein n=1 Tax=Reyranella sp. TaxID=1929291 RepID=UPI003BAA45C1
MDYLKELLARADLGSWESWSTQYRVLAVIVGLLAAYVVVRLVVPTVLRLLRPALFLVAVLIAVRLLYPAQVCSVELVANLPYLCAR